MDPRMASAVHNQQAAAYWTKRAQRELDRAAALRSVGRTCETALVCALLAQQNAASYSKRARTLLGVACAG